MKILSSLRWVWRQPVGPVSTGRRRLQYALASGGPKPALRADPFPGPIAIPADPHNEALLSPSGLCDRCAFVVRDPVQAGQDLRDLSPGRDPFVTNDRHPPHGFAVIRHPHEREIP